MVPRGSSLSTPRSQRVVRLRPAMPGGQDYIPVTPNRPIPSQPLKRHRPERVLPCNQGPTVARVWRMIIRLECTKRSQRRRTVHDPQALNGGLTPDPANDKPRIQRIWN